MQLFRPDGKEILPYLDSEKPRVPVEAFFIESNSFLKPLNM